MKKVYIVLIALLLGLLIYLVKYTERISNERDVYRTTSLELSDSVDMYSNKYNQIVAKKEIAEIDARNIKRSLVNAKADIKKLKTEVGRLKRVKQYSNIVTEIHDTITTVVRDTVIKDIPQKTFTFNNKYLSLSGVIEVDNISIDHKYRLQFQRVEYYDPGGLFKRGVLTEKFIFEDPALEVTQQKTFKTKIKQPFYKQPWFLITSGALLGVTITR